MPAYILLAFSEASVDLVIARGEGPDTLSIDSIHGFVLSRAIDSVELSSTPDGIQSDIPSEESASTQIKEILRSLGDDIEILPVVVRSHSMSFHKLILPFKEPSRLSQVVPLQIQDTVPFDVDGFLCASSVLKQGSDSEYDVFAVIIPQAEIAQIVAFTRSIGIEPMVITTTSVALSYLPKVLYPFSKDPVEQGNGITSQYVELDAREVTPSVSDLHKGLCVVLGSSRGVFAMASLLDGEPVDFREFDSAGLDDDELVSEVLCFLEMMIATHRHVGNELKSDAADKKPIILSSLDPGNRVNLNLIKRGYDVRSILISDFVGITFDADNSLVDSVPFDIAWTVSLLLTESRGFGKEFGKLLNLRTGPFTYHQAFQNVVSAFKEEVFWFVMALICLVFWVGAHGYVQEGQLKLIEDAMKNNIASVFGAEKAPLNSELVFVDGKLSELEEQLSGLGSISSLSPLESLRELSETIGNGIDIQIDSLNIGYSKITFRGSVPDFPSVGQLNSALEKNTTRFCKSKVDSAGRDTGSTRVKYSADIELCE